MLVCEPIGTPMEQNHGLEGYSEQVPTDKGYQRLVYCLIDLSHIRLDIAYAVSVVSKFMHNPSV